MRSKLAAVAMLAAVAAGMAVASPTAFRAPRSPAPRPFRDDSARLEAAASRRATRNAKRAARQRGVTMVEWMVGATIVVMLGSLVLAPTAKGRSRDSTDAPDGQRSGLVVRVDGLTGCHYLSDGYGLTARLGADGRPLCGAEVPK